jgi:hypothetical protein
VQLLLEQRQLSYPFQLVLLPIEPGLQLELKFLAFIQQSTELELEYSLEPLSSRQAFQHPMIGLEH